MRAQPPTMTRRLAGRPAAALVALLAAVALVGVNAPAAHAASSTTCSGSSTITYSPGLTNTPQTVAYTETDTFSSCLSTDLTLTSGEFLTSVDLPGASCDAAAVFTNTPYPITWNNGKTSSINLSYTDAIVDGTEQVTGVGTVTSGEFAGAAVTIVWVYPVLDLLQCSSSQGVTIQTGTLTAEIISLI